MTLAATVTECVRPYRTLPTMADSADIAALSLADFEPFVGEGFSIPLDHGAVALRLCEARASAHGVRAGGGFSLMFSAEAGPALGQGTYPIRHPRLGILDLFLVPLAPRDGVALYQAVFT